MSARKELLTEIDAFLKANNLSESTLGFLALRDPAFVLRLRRGRNTGIETAARIRKFMREYDPVPKKKVA